jgi:hypothetical protein
MFWLNLIKNERKIEKNPIDRFAETKVLLKRIGIGNSNHSLFSAFTAYA